MRISSETNRLYKYENHTKTGLPTKERTIQYLHKLAAKIWEKHGRAGLSVPSVVTWDKRYSETFGYSEIRLARNHRNEAVLIHEITHAIGFHSHDSAFVSKYISLLVEYGGADEGELIIGMGMYGVKVQPAG